MSVDLIEDWKNGKRKSENERLEVFLQEGLMIDCVRIVNVGRRKYESMKITKLETA